MNQAEIEAEEARIEARYARADRIFQRLRESWFQDLIDMREQAQTLGWDSRTHLITLAKPSPDGQRIEAISLDEAAADIRGTVRRRHEGEMEIVVVNVIREFASRMLDNDAAADYVRALSELALALSLRDNPSGD